MPENVSTSLSEYIAQAQRGLYSRIVGPEMLMKQTYFQVSDILTQTYGRKVWHALNNRTTFWNAIKKVVWGPTAGWRLRTDRGSGRSRPVTEVGTLPTLDVSNIVNVSSLPRIAATTFGASVRAIFSAQLEGGIGDILALEMENSQLDHIKELNQEMLAGSGFLVSAGSATTFTVPASVARHFKIGDTVGMWDTSASAHDRTGGSAVSAVNETTGVVTVATGTAFADGDVAYILTRAGLTSLDDVTMEDTVAVGGGQANVDVYNVTTRTAATYAAGASVSFNAGVGRDLSLNLLDTGIQKVRENGGEPKLIILGHDQYFRLERLLQAQQRYMGQEEYQVGVGDERTFPGTRVGMVLASYQGIPILPEVDAPKSVSTTDVVLGSNIFVLDTDYLEIAIAQPTQYIENRDYFAANALVVRGLLYTMAEFRARNLWVHSKVADLNA